MADDEGAILAAAREAPHASSRTALPRLLAAAREHLRMDVAFISEFSGGQRVFRFVDSEQPGPVVEGAAHDLEETYCQRVVDGRLPQLIRDARSLPAARELPVTEALPVGAHMGVPIVVGGGEVYGTLCCFSSAPDHSLTEKDLDVLRMVATVAAGFIEDDLQATYRHLAVEARINDALRSDDRLNIVFQPILGLDDGHTVYGVEALSRFAGPPHLPPDRWFKDAESVGRGQDLELHALEAAVSHLPAVPEGLFLTVNLSPSSVLSPRTTEALLALPAERLVIEMTEHAAIEDYQQLKSALEPLREQGFRIAVDDAGAGYASLRHILWLEPEYIKLDMSITRDIDSDRARAALAAALVEFAAKVGSLVIAEGIETERELRALRRIGASAGQGYYLARPGPLPVNGTGWRRPRSSAVAGASA